MIGLFLHHSNSCRHTNAHTYIHIRKRVCSESVDGGRPADSAVQRVSAPFLCQFVHCKQVCVCVCWGGGGLRLKGKGGFKWEISQKPILVNVGHEVQRSFLLHQPLLQFCSNDLLLILFCRKHQCVWSGCKSGWQVWESKPRWSEDRGNKRRGPR